VSAHALSRPAGFTRTGDPWTVEYVDSIDHFLSLCTRLRRGHAEVFQQRAWLRSWYACVARQPGLRPLLLAVRREGEPGDAMLLPLILRSEGRVRVAECADLGVTDYNAPLVRDGLALGAEDAAVLAQALRRALRGIDLLRLDKLVEACGGQPNPWLRLFDSLPSPLSGHRLRVHDDYADWMAHIGKHARKEFERSWRVFQREPQARFVRATDVDEGLSLLRRMAQLQHERHAGKPGYRLAEEAYDGFYEHYLRANLDKGGCVVTALLAGDEMVAGLFSVHDGRRLTMLRIAIGGERWKSCAPGKLLLERTIHALHAQGCREFDLGIGDYEHKRAFRPKAVPLHESCVALSLRGLALRAAWRLKHLLRRQPALRAAARRLRQRARPA